MSLVKNLKEMRDKAIDEKVLEFAEEMEVAIIESAKNGYAGYNYKLNNENQDKHIMCSELFIEKLRSLMDGVNVEFKKEEKKFILGGTYYEHYIHFNWKD
ncbi:hypothetical protein [Bacillus toyonensis]|uniref:hypothetical protein n=1 Tax=Bacillus toyonensis TaxID=155322 RepID=UPI000BF0C9B1|nr:hypothetical protein [Bacillus toyonensis]PEM45568.1 hypothetical protein CN636_09290 [Bacillus toyonensis]